MARMNDLGELDIRVDPDLKGRAFRDVLPLARARRLCLTMRPTSSMVDSTVA